MMKYRGSSYQDGAKHRLKLRKGVYSVLKERVLLYKLNVEQGIDRQAQESPDEGII